jgi:hypothetical protein
MRFYSLTRTSDGSDPVDFVRDDIFVVRFKTIKQFVLDGRIDLI